LAEPKQPNASVAVIVGVVGPVAVGVPARFPLAGSIVMPAGSPVAVQVIAPFPPVLLKSIAPAAVATPNDSGGSVAGARATVIHGHTTSSVNPCAAGGATPLTALMVRL